MIDMDQFRRDPVTITRGTFMGNMAGIAALIAATGLMAAPTLAAERAPAARLSLAPVSGRAVAPAHRASRAGHGAASGAIINLGLVAAIGMGVLLATAGGSKDAADSN